MGIGMIGGFTTSTLLTLLVVPVLFTYIDNFQQWIMKLVKYGFGKQPYRNLESEYEVLKLSSNSEEPPKQSMKN
jgi:secreted trypsin-like serine protease